MPAARDRANLTRRRMLRDAGAGVLGITAVGTLVSCGNDDGGGPADGSYGGPAAEPTPPAPDEESAPSEPPAEDPPADEAPAEGSLAALDDIPVGEAVAARASDGSEVILARPSEEEVVGFSAICTHQGCTVAPSGSELHCPCHGSVFDALTGENVSGPAPRPLDPFEVRLDGTAVVES